MDSRLIKRALSITLAGTMIFSMAGCGKDKEEKKEKLDIYNSIVEAQYDVTFEKAKIIDNIVYASYFNWDMENTSEDSVEEQGFATYNFGTKEQNQVKLDIENAYINNFCVDNNKNIVADVSQVITEDNGEEQEPVTQEETYQYRDISVVYDQHLECISVEEGEIKTFDLADGETGDMEMLISAEYDGDNRLFGLYTSTSGDSEAYYIKITSQDGEDIAIIAVDEMVENLIRLDNGKVLCMKWGEEATEIYEIDVEGGKLGKKVADIGGFINAVFAGKNNSILYDDNGYLMRLDCNNGKSKKILKFIDSEILSDRIVAITEFDNGEFGVVLQDYDSNKSEVNRLVKYDPDSDTAKRQEIHIGVFGLDGQVQEDVINFNKSNNQYKIIIDEYMSEDEDDYDNALKRFNAALTSDNCPDIIDLSSISVDKYVKNGVLEALEPYLEKDSDLKQETFVQSVLEAYKVDGKIYTIPRDFMLEGFVGYKSKLGEEIGWTMKEFVDYAESLPEGTEILPDLTSDGLLWTMLAYSMDEYVNWTTGECNFKNDDFISLLEFCSNYESAEEYYKDYEYDEMNNEITKAKNGQVILRNMYLDGVYTYLEEKAVYGEDIMVKGYPSKEDKGIVLESSSVLLGISSKSKYKDVAWEFIRQSYMPEEQVEMNLYGFPIRQDKLDELFKEALEYEVKKDAEGNEYIGSYGYDDLELLIPPATEKDIEEIKKIIDSADTFGDINMEVYNIIEEETEAFFKGQKSAEAVADVIQSRVSIYVKENR